MDVEKLLGKLLHEATGSGGKHFTKKYKKYKKKHKYKGKKGYAGHSSSSHSSGHKSSLLGNLTGNLKSGKGLLTAIGLGVGAYEIYRTGQQAKQRQTDGGMAAQYSQPSHTPAGPAGPAQTAPPPPPPPSGHAQQTQDTSSVQEEPVVVEAVEPLHTGLSEQDVACRLIQVMVGAAHADGTLDSEEEKAILDRLRDVELAQEEKMFLLEELHHPRSIAELTQGIEDARLGQAMYAVAASAVNIDTESEREWFNELGTALGLSAEVCKFIEENQ